MFNPKDRKQLHEYTCGWQVGKHQGAYEYKYKRYPPGFTLLPLVEDDEECTRLGYIKGLAESA